MKLTYIYHSGFCIEINDITIIIDFYKDTKEKKGIVYKDILPNFKRLYVLSTHSHIDHFNRDIQCWDKIYKNITYIFSKDILDNESGKIKDNIHYLDKLDTYNDGQVKVKAYGSTDIGSSFYIEAGGKKIFHAGDLNNWHWNEESTTEEIREAEDSFLRELSVIREDIKEIDLAMFPVDPRLGKDFMKGAEQFIGAIDVGFLVPMHFGEYYKKVAPFESIASKYHTKYWAIAKKGESINI